ncbi:unnamed protein product [Effrenium voratum]|nr:unnamed protein product [Effrenium voratum]
MAWLNQPEQNGAAFRAGSLSPQNRAQVCPKCGSVYAHDAIFCRHCGQKREVSTAVGRAWVDTPFQAQANVQLPRVPPVALPGVQRAEPVTGATAPSSLVMPCFDALDTNHDGVISRAEYQNAGGLVYAAPTQSSIRSVSPLPTRGVIYNGVPRALSPDTSRSPIGRVITPSPRAVPVHTAQPMMVPSIHVVPPSEQVQSPNLSEDLLKRIDGVVSEMEKELSQDLEECVKSPLGLKGEIKVDISGAHGDDDNDSTLDWIDKQIHAIEGRREACEVRQVHLSDLRRLVADGERYSRRQLRNEGLDDLEVNAQVRESPARRLSILEGEHEELKKQVESERVELLKVRSNLEVECERRLQEARMLAESVQDSRQRAVASEEAANQRAREAAIQVQTLQERLREAEATLERERQQFRLAQDAQAAAGADLRQLEENSRTVLADCRSLQQKVKELELERGAFLEVQAKSEEEKRSLIIRINQFEEERAKELELALHSHREQWREAAGRDLEQLRAQLTATHSKNLKAAEKQGESRALEVHGSVQQQLEERCTRLQAEKDAEERSRVEVQRLHAQATEDAERLREDQRRLQVTLAAEVQAKEQLQLQHQNVLQDMEKLKGDQAELAKDQEAEKAARLQAEQKHAAVLQDMERQQADVQKLQADKLTEQAARQKAEQEHQIVLKDMEQVRVDKERVAQEKEQEARLRQEAESKHALVLRDLQQLKEDQLRLRADKDAEEKAKLEVQRLHQAVLDEKNSLHGNHSHLQELLNAETKAKEEMRQRHSAVESDKQQMERDNAELQSAKAKEEQLRAEAERKHQQLMQDMDKMRGDQAKLQADKDEEKRLKEEAERRHAQVLRDMQQLQADRDKLQADQAGEKRAREEAERKHLEVVQDKEQISADLQNLQRDKEAEQRAKEAMARQHEEALKQMELVNADQRKLKLDKEEEARARLDLESKHQVVLQDLERTRAEKDQLHGQHQASQKQVETIRTELSTLQIQHQQLQADRDRLQSTQSESSRGHEEAYAKMKASHEAELQSTKDLGLQLKSEWEARHQSLLQELEQVRTEHRRAQQEKEDERRAKERVHSEHQSTTRQLESLQSQLSAIQTRSSTDRGSLEDAQSRIRSLQSENEMLTGDINILKKMKQEKEQAEASLLEAERSLRAELKVIQRQLEEREHQVKQFEERRGSQEEKLSSLLVQLKDEQKEGEELRQELRQARSSGELLQQTAQETLEKFRLLQQENEELRRQSSESQQKRRMSMHRMSLWAPPVLNIEDEVELLPNSKDEFVLQVREAHKRVDALMQSATEVHNRTITAQLDGAAVAESKGSGVRRGLSDYENQYEIESERRTELSDLEAGLHDLRALKEEVALQHHLTDEVQTQIVDYLERDAQRCQEEIDIMKPSSALASLPDELIQVLMHMIDEGLPSEFEHGFSPMHWAAQRGRRDLIDYIRQNVAGGFELLRSRDSQGRIPLFFAERAGKVGLAYHLRKIGGSDEVLVRSEKRPDVEDIAPAYRKVLEQIEQRGWNSMKWKDDFTMLHWAASHGKKDLCVYLISQQADPDAKDNKGRTPVNVASDAKHFDVVAALQSKAAVQRQSVSHLAFASATE